MKFLLLGFILLFSSQAFSLELDEKLTVRVLGISSSKKTVLTNRGLEDGLVVGDHAKFFLTTGVVARGVVVKASPSRSIWSVYRIIDADKISKDRVMNIKISSALKLTNDPSRALKVDDMSSSIPVLSRGGSEPIPEVSGEDRAELDGMMDNQDPIIVGSGVSKKTLEVFGVLSLNSLSGTYEQGEASGDSSAGHLDLTVGFEKYFDSPNSILGEFSIFGLINSRSSSSGVFVNTKTSWFEYGIGANWHYYNKPLSYARPIGFATIGGGLGSASSETTVSSTSTSSTDPLNGSSNFFFIGTGAKYYLKNGFGARLVADYFRSGSTFEFDDDENLTLALSGFRIRAGLSYRW
jgi:hypothetical protein